MTVSRAQNPEGPVTPEILCRRALRQRRRGEGRRAMVLFRQAAYSSSGDARLWTLYGVQCLRMGRVEPGIQALTQAAWLRDRGGEHRKAEVTRALIAAARHAA